jgi:hypothetical protein
VTNAVPTSSKKPRRRGPATPILPAPPAAHIIGLFEDGKSRRAEELQGELIVRSRHGPRECPRPRRARGERGQGEDPLREDPLAIRGGHRSREPVPLQSVGRQVMFDRATGP